METNSELEPPDKTQRPGQSQEDAADRAWKRQSLLRIPLWMLAAGFATGFFGEGDLLDLIVHVIATVAFLVLLHRWCAADARLHRIELWRYFLVTLVVCPGPLLVVPIHLLRTRGIRGLLSILLALAYFIAVCVVQALGFFAGAFVGGNL